VQLSYKTRALACAPLLLGMSFSYAVAHAETAQLSDTQIAEAIVGQSRDAYSVTESPRALPEDLARNGSRCGGRSAYSRPGGASPNCYVSDVTARTLRRIESVVGKVTFLKT
jgi:hypothetical protein